MRKNTSIITYFKTANCQLTETTIRSLATKFITIVLVSSIYCSAVQANCVTELAKSHSTISLDFNEKSILKTTPTVKLTADEKNQIVQNILNPPDDIEPSRFFYQLGFSSSNDNPRAFEYDSLQNWPANEYGLPSAISPEVFSKLTLAINQMRDEFEEHTGKKIEKISYVIRVTSDHMGFAIRPNQNADSEGMHTHSSMRPLVSFVAALQGPGTIYMTPDNQKLQANEDDILSFGYNVRHGSPSSSEPRLILVGSFKVANN